MAASIPDDTGNLDAGTYASFTTDAASGPAYSDTDLALGADLADAVNLGALMTWDNPLAEHRDTDLDEDDCRCPEDCPTDSGHEWWCTR